MASEFVKKVALYKELYEANAISEEQYLSFIKEVVNEQTKEAIETKDLSFEGKREQLVEENRKKSQDLRDRLNEYERKGAEEERKKLQDKEQESEISFAIQFLSQIYDSYGNRVYSDELLEDETNMSLYEMQHIIESIKNSAPEKYNEIISKIDPSKVIEIKENEPSVENETVENKSTTWLPEGYSDFMVDNTNGPDYSSYIDNPEINTENKVENKSDEPEVVAIEQPKPTLTVDLTNEQKAETELDNYLKKNGIGSEDLESTSELTEEEQPKKPKLITRAKDTLINKINSKNGKINAKLIATAAVIAGITLGAITLGAGTLATAAVTGLSSAVAVGAVSESIKNKIR